MSGYISVCTHFCGENFLEDKKRKNEWHTIFFVILVLRD